MKQLLFLLPVLLIFGCTAPRLPLARPAQPMGGGAFYTSVLSIDQQQREERALHQMLQGNMPSRVRNLVRIKSDTVMDGKAYRLEFFVTGDYLAIGDDADFARIPLTPITAQTLADTLHCFLPTRKIVNMIYKQARVKLPPVPMYAFRDSSVTMYQHHLIIEGQRRLKKGLIAGIKKDIVLTDRLNEKPDKVAIYGWHQMNGLPIQPIYTGHTANYVDYSHGIRLIHRTLKIDGRKYDYEAVLSHPQLRHLICDEEDCSFMRYPRQVGTDEAAGTSSGGGAAIIRFRKGMQKFL